LQDTSSHFQSEKRSKKKHEPAASISTTGPQETLAAEQVKKEKKKDKKQKRPKVQADENEKAAGETMQPEQDVGGENQSEKKKHRKRSLNKHLSSIKPILTKGTPPWSKTVLKKRHRLILRRCLQPLKHTTLMTLSKKTRMLRVEIVNLMKRNIRQQIIPQTSRSCSLMITP
jgi:hypothetical protein